MQEFLKLQLSERWFKTAITKHNITQQVNQITIARLQYFWEKTIQFTVVPPGINNNIPLQHNCLGFRTFHHVADPSRSPIYIISILFITNTHSHDAIYLHTVNKDDSMQNIYIKEKRKRQDNNIHGKARVGENIKGLTEAGLKFLKIFTLLHVFSSTLTLDLLKSQLSMNVFFVVEVAFGISMPL